MDCVCGRSLDRDHNDAATILNRSGYVRWGIRSPGGGLRHSVAGLESVRCVTNAAAIVCFWISARSAWVFLEEARSRLFVATQQRVTMSDTRHSIQHAHRVHLRNEPCRQFQHQESFAAIIRQIAALQRLQAQGWCRHIACNITQRFLGRFLAMMD